MFLCVMIESTRTLSTVFLFFGKVSPNLRMDKSESVVQTVECISGVPFIWSFKISVKNSVFIDENGSLDNP